MVYSLSYTFNNWIESIVAPSYQQLAMQLSLPPLYGGLILFLAVALLYAGFFYMLLGIAFKDLIQSNEAIRKGSIVFITVLGLLVAWFIGPMMPLFVVGFGILAFVAMIVIFYYMTKSSISFGRIGYYGVAIEEKKLEKEFLEVSKYIESIKKSMEKSEGIINKILKKFGRDPTNGLVKSIYGTLEEGKSIIERSKIIIDKYKNLINAQIPPEQKRFEYMTGARNINEVKQQLNRHLSIINDKKAELRKYMYMHRNTLNKELMKMLEELYKELSKQSSEIIKQIHDINYIINWFEGNMSKI